LSRDSCGHDRRRHAAVARLGGAVETPSLRGDLAVVETVLPEGRARDLQRQLSGLTRGEGVLESAFAGYEPVIGEQPSRRWAGSATMRPCSTR
jgi:hypothetical protein